ncbi:MAG: antitoxin VbhA family protein [Betaproteobacteria bacterium]|nr:antitoxin VbhA family protein [Betaproteobacteria bacterium]
MTITPEERERRRKAVKQARAANIRAGHVHDPVLEAINDRFISGELTLDQFHEEIMASIGKPA